SRAIPTMPRCSSRTFRSWCSIPASIRDGRRYHCCRPSHTPKDRQCQRSPAASRHLYRDTLLQLLLHKNRPASLEQNAAYGVALSDLAGRLSFRPTLFLRAAQQLSDIVMPPPVLSTDFNRLAILLDIDGTLLDLAPTPRQVFASRALRET